MCRSLHPILDLILLYDLLLLGPALVKLKSVLLCLPSSFLNAGEKYLWNTEHAENNERSTLLLLQWFFGFSALPCGTNCCVASVSLVLFRHQLSSPYPCTSAKNHRCENLGHCDFSQCSWQKGSWLQRSEASLNMKKLFKCMLFL